MYTPLTVTLIVVVIWWILAGLGCVLWIVWRHVLLPLVGRLYFAARQDGDRS